MIMATKIWIGTTSDPTVAGNWNGGAPADGDSLVFPAGNGAACAGNDFAATMQFASLTVEDGNTSAIGSAAVPFKVALKDGSTYGPASFAGTGVSYFTVNNPLSINVTAAASFGTGYGLNLTGTNDDSAKGTVNVQCTSTSMRVSLAANAGESGNFNAVNVSGGTVSIGSGVTKTGAATPSLLLTGGVVYSNAPLNAVSKTGGELFLMAGAVASYSGTDGKTHYRSTGTLTAGTAGGNDNFMVDDLRSRTFTNFTVSGQQAKFTDPSKTVTFTNPLSLAAGARCAQLDLGTGITIARG